MEPRQLSSLHNKDFSFLFLGGDVVSVKINTKEKLDMNAYERMVIIEKNTGFWVKVSSSKPSEDYSFPSYKIFKCSNKILSPSTQIMKK